MSSETINHSNSTEESNCSSSKRRFIIPAISAHSLYGNCLSLNSNRFNQSESYFSPSSHDTSCFSTDVQTGENNQLNQVIRKQWSEDSLFFSDDEEDATTLPQSNVNKIKEKVSTYRSEEEPSSDDPSAHEFFEMFSQSVLIKRSDDYSDDESNITTSRKRLFTYKLRLAFVVIFLLLAIIIPIAIHVNRNNGQNHVSSIRFMNNTIIDSNLSSFPSIIPTTLPSTSLPTTYYPSNIPSTSYPSNIPSIHPTLSKHPSNFPSISPTLYPSNYPSNMPTNSFIPSISLFPSYSPSHVPSNTPTSFPSLSMIPTTTPTKRNLIPFLTFPKFPTKP